VRPGVPPADRRQPAKKYGNDEKPYRRADARGEKKKVRKRKSYKLSVSVHVFVCKGKRSVT